MQFGTHEIVTYLAIITVMITFARIVGGYFRKFGMPAVIGELVAGIFLGPTVLAHLAPELYTHLFKSVPEAKLAFDSLLTFASVILLFVVGLEIKVSQMYAERKIISWMGVLGVVLPFVVGAGVGYAFLGIAPEGVSDFGFVAIIGAAFAVSALPVIARILLDLDLLKTRIGSIIIGSAAANDIAGWLLFIAALGIAGSNAHQLVPVWVAVLGALLLTLFAFTKLPKILNFSIKKLATFFGNHATAQGVVVLPLLFGMSMVTEYIGLHALFGAFVLGIALSESDQFQGHLRESVEVLNAAFFAPLYFVAVGLKADFFAGFDLVLITTVFVLAFSSKILAARLGGYFAGLASREATAVGFGLAARGGMGIIVSSIAFATGAIDLTMFEALVVMAVVTSFLAAFIPKFLTPQ
jgi:Kef-type K+ transport system membrane component KefB